jgi:hypothetical protein
MFLDIDVAYCRDSPEFTAGEVYDFGFLWVERDIIQRTPPYHLVDRAGCHSSSFVHCVAYGQDGRVVCISEATLRVAQSVDWLSIEQKED